MSIECERVEFSPFMDDDGVMDPSADDITWDLGQGRYVYPL